MLLLFITFYNTQEHFDNNSAPQYALVYYIAYFINSTSESDHALNTFLETTPVLLLFYAYFTQL